MVVKLYSIFELEERVLYKKHKAFFRHQDSVFKVVDNVFYQAVPPYDEWTVNCKTRVNSQFELYHHKRGYLHIKGGV